MRLFNMALITNAVVDKTNWPVFIYKIYLMCAFDIK
jgi:hypothetical protein